MWRTHIARALACRSRTRCTFRKRAFASSHSSTCYMCTRGRIRARTHSSPERAFVFTWAWSRLMLSLSARAGCGDTLHRRSSIGARTSARFEHWYMRTGSRRLRRCSKSSELERGARAELTRFLIASMLYHQRVPRARARALELELHELERVARARVARWWLRAGMLGCVRAGIQKRASESTAT